MLMAIFLTGYLLFFNQAKNISQNQSPIPSSGVEMENIVLALSQEQITSLINKYKPASIRAEDIEVTISAQTLLAKATSLYPFLRGELRAAVRLDLNRFYINDVYLGKIKAPKKVSNFIEEKGNKLIANLSAKYGIVIDTMELVDEKIIVKASVPKGIITVNPDGTILVNDQ